MGTTSAYYTVQGTRYESYQEALAAAQAAAERAANAILARGGGMSGNHVASVNVLRDDDTVAATYHSIGAVQS
jgi:hypothetical protein